MIDQGEILSTAAMKLTELYHQYGEVILSRALKKALELKIGRYSYVARICHQLDKATAQRPSVEKKSNAKECLTAKLDISNK
jgi:hypothetical protein